MKKSVALWMTMWAPLPLLAQPPEPPSPQPPPGVSEIIPAEGATYPSNAALFFYVEGDTSLDVSGLSVTSDGATLAAERNLALDVQHVDGGYVRAQAVVLKPSPATGATVTLSGVPCSGCGYVERSWTAGDADTAAPNQGGGLLFDAITYANPGEIIIDGLTVFGDTGWYVSSTTLAAGVGESPVLAYLTVRTAQGQPDLTVRSAFVTQDDQIIPFYGLLADLQSSGEPAAEAACFSLLLVDAAGNPAGSPLEGCAPCHFIDSEGTFPISGAAPSWSEADVYAAGPCAPEEGSPPPTPEPTQESAEGTPTPGAHDSPSPEEDASPSPDEEDPSSACASSPNPSSGALTALALLSVLGLRVGRRRSEHR